MLIFGFGMVAGLALTNERKWLRSPWFWAGPVGGRQCGVGTMAFRYPRTLDQASVCDPDGADGRSDWPNKSRF